jgi:glycosyltransferase involved in cell wall biosynthesis
MGKLPDRLVCAMIRIISAASFSDNIYFRYVRALAERPAYMKQQMNKLGRVIAPTRLMIKILTEHGLLPEKITFSPFGINLKPFLSRVRKEAKDCLRIGYIGTLSEPKGGHILLKAIRSLSEDESVVLKIYGKPNEFPEYVAELRRIADDDSRITFCGTFPNTQIGDVFSDIDLLVVPSIWYENTPLVIYSAHAAGCPVIASNLGGMSEVVHHGVNGLLFEQGDVSGLAEAISQLAHDRRLLRRLTENIRQPKSIESYVAELVGIYADVIEEIRGVPSLR